MLAKELILKTLQQIQREKITATPEVYEKIFCQIATKNGLDLEECKRAKPLINRLNEPIRSSAINRKISSLDDLAIFLIGELNRATISTQKESIQIIYELVDLLAKAMTPSFADFDTKSLNLLLNEIENAPIKVLEKSWKTKVIKLVAERIQFDRKKISSEAHELDSGVEALFSVVKTMAKELKDESNLAENLDAEIRVLDPENFTKEIFSAIKSKLVLLSSNLKNHSSKLIDIVEKQEDEISRLKSEIAELSSRVSCLIEENTIDYLTQVESRRSMEKTLDSFEDRYQTKNEDYAVLFFDIDHFKRINDLYGHEGGDKVLQAVAKLIASKLIKGATVGRYGGEEFVALLPKVSLIEAVNYADNIRKEVAKSSFKYLDKTIKMTISCGVAIRSKAIDAQDSIKTADLRLYSAKNRGRDRVEGE